MARRWCPTDSARAHALRPAAAQKASSDRQAVSRKSARIAAGAAYFTALVIVCAAYSGAGEAADLATSPRTTIAHVFKGHTQQALRVARCESGLNPRAVSPTGDAGLFQANYSAHHWNGESFTEFKRRMFDVPYHVRWAYRLSRGGTNWNAWRWSEHCWG